MKLNIPFPDEICEFTKMESIQPLTNLELRIAERFGSIVKKFKILHHGWEMDAYGYVVNTDNGKQIVVTDHGNPILSNRNYLISKIKEYEKVISETSQIVDKLLVI